MAIHCLLKIERFYIIFWATGNGKYCAEKIQICISILAIIKQPLASSCTLTHTVSNESFKMTVAIKTFHVNSILKKKSDTKESREGSIFFGNVPPQRCLGH